jgi:biofilm PGA synthesis N-glycosyltransferase PgaC
MEEKGRRHIYVPVKLKFGIATLVAAGWFTFSFIVSRTWFAELSTVVGTVPAYVIIIFVALIPGFLNMHLLVSIVLDRPPPLHLDIEYPPVTILMAAYNEEQNVWETFRGIRGLDYPGEIQIMVVDDGSTDRTVDVLELLEFPGLEVIKADHGGKAHALNEGLGSVRHGIVVSIDADTFLHPQSLRRVVARLVSDPAGTGAVAGSVLAKNSRASFMCRLQEWDYFAAICSVKRQQGLYQGALVAQGAFSAFFTDVVRQQRGWPSVIGEDIVMTWALLKSGYRVGYEPTAVGFTLTPTTLRGFWKQRRRWARGMIEGIKRHGDLVWRSPSMAGFFVGMDFLFPLLDSFFTFAFIPGVVLALTGRFYLAGPMTLLVLPITFLIVMVMFWKEKQVFKELGLKVRRNRVGAVVYMLFYQFLMSPICVVGYVQEIFGLRKKW